MLAAHLSQAPKPLRDERPDTPTTLATLVMRCLAKPADERPANADEVLRSLEAIATPSGGYPTGIAAAPPRRAWWTSRVATAVAGASFLVAAVIVALVSRRTATTTSDSSIAVLPLTNLSGDSTNNYFGEGLAEEITGALAKAGLRVIGRGSARSLAAKGLDAREIAKQLGVSSVLQGNVQRAGDQVRISVTLVSGADGAVKWTEKYDRQLKDVFAVQDEIARSVVTQLRATLTGGTNATLVHTETSDPEAHTLYLQGLYLWNRRGAPSLRQAIQRFDAAIAKDPKYARAYAGIALAQVVLTFYSDENADSLTARGNEAADKALALDSTLAEAWTAKAFGDAQHWKNADAEQEFQRAIRFDSTFATARFWHALLLNHVGRAEDADREESMAIRLEPSSLVILTGRSQILNTQRRLPEAVDDARKTLALDSTYRLADAALATALTYSGQFDEAIRIFKRIVDLPGVRPSDLKGNMALALVRAGRTAEARSVIASVQRSFAGRRIPSGALAAALYELGDHDAGIATLEAAVNEHDPWLINYSRAPRFDKIRANARGKALLESTER
jgi:serine/threonine-protein kinase